MTQDHKTFEQRCHFTNTVIAHFISLMCLWKIDMQDRKALLGIRNTYNLAASQADPNIHLKDVATEDALLRISTLVKMVLFVHDVLPPHERDLWVLCENPIKPFNGDTPLTYMIEHGLECIFQVTSMLATFAGETYP